MLNTKQTELDNDMNNLGTYYARPYRDYINYYFGFIDGNSDYNPSLLVNAESDFLQLRFKDSNNSEKIYNYDLTNRTKNVDWTVLSETYGAYYFKRNKIVTIVIDFADITVANNDVIGVLPSGCRPPGVVYCRNGFDNQNGEFAAYNSGYVRYLSPTGSCTYGHATLTFATL